MSGVREEMRTFWQTHCQDASVQEMMLNSDAEEMTKHEVPEILSYLPPVNGKQLLELGAGIGRFTGELARSADHVVAVDFMEKFINKNKELNSKYNNIDFHCADVTKLKLEADSVDIIFSNWLMMYLEDEEVQNLLHNELTWLREGGYLFARESCRQPSTTSFIKSEKNPTNYRDPFEYFAMANTAICPTGTDGEVYGFDLVMSKSMNHRPYQIVWLFRKTRREVVSNTKGETLLDILNNFQLVKNNIRRNEMFGRTLLREKCIGPTKDILSRLDLQQGQSVLDLGCKFGDTTFYMVKEFGVNVVAMDASYERMRIGMERLEEEGLSFEDVEFEFGDATERCYMPETFDAVYSRDVISHVTDKLALFNQIFKWLKKGGKLLFTISCYSDVEPTEHNKDVGQRLVSPVAHSKLLEKSGFTKVQTEDRTDLMEASLQRQLTIVRDVAERNIKVMATEDSKCFVQKIKDKLQRTNKCRWLVFSAVK